MDWIEKHQVMGAFLLSTGLALVSGIVAMFWKLERRVTRLEWHTGIGEDRHAEG